MEDCALTNFYSAEQRARFYAATGKRESVRTFAGPPDEKQQALLEQAAKDVCLPGVRIVVQEGEDKSLYRPFPIVETIMGTSVYAAVITDSSVPRSRLHGGISGEAFILEAVSLGVGTCWVGGTYKKSAVQTELGENEKLEAIIPLGIPAEEEMHERKRKNLRSICTTAPEDWPLWAYNAAECVRIAPSALNRQPWKLSYAGRTLQLMKSGLFLNDLDLGIAVLHMSLGAQEKEHVIRWGEGREVATLLAEDRV